MLDAARTAAVRHAVGALGCLTVRVAGAGELTVGDVGGVTPSAPPFASRGFVTASPGA